MLQILSISYDVGPLCFSSALILMLNLNDVYYCYDFIIIFADVSLKTFQILK